MSYFDILSAKKVFKDGGNVTEYLRSQRGIDENTSDIIEIAYDLQSGSYIEFFESNEEFCLQYADQLSRSLCVHIDNEDTIVDIGTGELTTFSLVMAQIKDRVSKAYAFDISWSRLAQGIQFAEEKLGIDSRKLIPFMADIKSIPLPSKSVDIVTSNHALEPNGGNLENLLSELFRVTRKKLVLFEPSYELNNSEGRRRMDRLGYIKGLESMATKLGAKVVDLQPLEIVSNPLNPTACFVIEPPAVDLSPMSKVDTEPTVFTIPGTDLGLSNVDNFLVSPEAGLVFPVLGGIPVLRRDSAILATGY